MQGSGNVGGLAPNSFMRPAISGGISDIHGGIYNPQGIDIPDALSYLRLRALSRVMRASNL